jgi:K+-transporting ATPase ATPase C chain
MPGQLRPALIVFVALALITGVVYPLLVTAIAQTFFAAPANGSLITVAGRERGSRLIGQPFWAPAYFWGRPSATAPVPYDASGSAGSNLGPTNPALRDAVRARIAALRAADPTVTGAVPVDLVTASASGLDPDISVAAALVQVPRVAKARHLSAETVRDLVEAHVIGRTLGLFGEPRVNVLLLNLALDEQDAIGSRTVAARTGVAATKRAATGERLNVR